MKYINLMLKIALVSLVFASTDAALGAERVPGDPIDALHHAISSGNVVETRNLCRSLSDDEIITRRNNYTALNAAVECRINPEGKEEETSGVVNLALVRILLAAVHDADKRSSFIMAPGICGYTNIHTAALKGHAGVVQALLEALPINERIQFIKNQDNTHRSTPLHQASIANNVNTVRILLDALPENERVILLNTRNDLGRTPLQEAIYCYCDTGVRLDWDFAEAEHSNASSYKIESLVNRKEIYGNIIRLLAAYHRALGAVESLGELGSEENLQRFISREYRAVSAELITEILNLLRE